MKVYLAEMRKQTIAFIVLRLIVLLLVIVLSISTSCRLTQVVGNSKWQGSTE